MILHLLSAVCIPFALGIVSTNFDDVNKPIQEVNYRLDTSDSVSEIEVSYPIYDDVGYSITLNANQLNNYRWDNFLQYLSTLQGSTLSDISIIYEESTYSYEDSQIVEDEYFYITFLSNGYFVAFNYLSYDNQFEYVDTSDDTQYEFEEDVEIILDVNTYNNVKNAIQADIQANTSSSANYVSVLQDMISLLVGGITGIATGIGNGVQSLVTNLFLGVGGNTLSTFGAIVCIFGGIALAIGLSRLIFNWIQSLGAR